MYFKESRGGDIISIAPKNINIRRRPSCSSTSSTMPRTLKAAIVTEAGKPPVFTEATLPEPTENEVTVKVVAAGYSHLVRNRASGAHYSASKDDAFVGVDGVGYVEGTGELVMFFSLNGAYSQYVNVQKHHVFPFPEGYTSEKAVANVAALCNGAISSIMAFTRIKDLPANPTVAILGVTGMSGHVAIQVAKKQFNAKRVIGIARNTDKLKALQAKEPLLDDIISYEDDDANVIESAALADVDVVLDYVWGSATARFLTVAIKSKKDSTQQLTWINLGEMSGEPTFAVPAAALRGNNLFIAGSGIGPFTGKEMGMSFTKTTHALAKGELNYDSEAIPLENISEEWVKPFSSDGARKYFVIPH